MRISLTVVAVVVGVLWWGYSIRQRYYDDFDAFWALGHLAVEMIMEEGKGVVVESDDAFISSFEDFFAYVQRKRPDAVSTIDAPNPFPGLLPSGSYKFRSAPATQPTDLLLWSTRVHSGGRGPYQFALVCDGSFQNRLVASYRIGGASYLRSRKLPQTRKSDEQPSTQN
jgi:hypothetical protein